MATLPFASERVLSYLRSATEPKNLIDITIGAGLAYSTVTIHVRMLAVQGLVSSTRVEGKNLFFLTPQEAA